MTVTRNLHFIDNLVPSVSAGDHTITVTQTPTGGNIPSGTAFTLTQDFTVTGLRLRVEADEIHGVYPPPGTAGRFDLYLPHVALERRIVPWERRVSSDDDGTTPWLGVLLFAEGELPDDPKALGGTETGIARTLLDPRNDSAVSVPDFADHPLTVEEETATINTIRVPGEVFSRIAPTSAELAHLAHIRTPEDTGGSHEERRSAEYAYLSANRLPDPQGGTVRGPPGLLRGPQGAAGPPRPGQGARTPGIAPPLVVRLRAGRGGDGLLRPARTAHGRARPTPPAGPPRSGVRRHSRHLHPPRSPPDRDGTRGAATRAGRPARRLRLLPGAVDPLPDGPGRSHRRLVDHGRGRLRRPERGPPHGVVTGTRTGPGRSGVLRRVGPGGGPGTEGRPEPRADRRGIPGPRRGRRHGRPRVLGRRPSGRPVVPGGVLVLPGRGGVGPGGWGHGARAAGGDGGPRPSAGRGAPAIPRPGPARRAGHAVWWRTEHRHRGGRRRIGRRGPGRPGDDDPGRRSVLPLLDAIGDRNGGGDRRGPPGDGALRRARARLLLTRPLRPSGRRRP